MIQIQVDDKACVSCGLCADTCPTKVFSFDESKELPEVTQTKECFGCLSCSEICPADAIVHDGIVRSETFYHDAYTLNIANRLASPSPLRYGIIDTPAGRDAAMRDISVRLLSVGAVLKDVVGAGLPSVGLMAGRSLATQLPRYRPARNLNEAFDLATVEFAPAWQLTFTQDSDGAIRIGVNGCFVRELCTRNDMPLGQELCVLFFNYLAGYLGKMAKTQLKLVEVDRGESCRYTVKVLR